MISFQIKPVEICNECGKSVKFGSGLYVNRVVDFNNKTYRKQMEKPFYIGDFICVECDKMPDKPKKKYNAKTIKSIK